MQKNIKITISLLVVVIFVIGIISVNSNNISKKKIKKDGILYALSVDGESSTSFPSKGLYKVGVTCKNATGKWLYDEWKLSIENITGDVYCDIDFTTIEKTYLNDYVTRLATSTSSQTDWQVVNENGYRYEGKNPNNYVLFNNEYWRIIGVFDSDTHGQSGKKLVKIIRNETLGNLTWGKSYANDWSTSSLKTLLNEYYYKASDGTNSGYCFGYTNAVSTNCDYTKKGIQSAYRNMVANVTWYLGGTPNYKQTAEQYYNNERGTTVYSGRPTSTDGYVGLIYPSDFGYSALSSSCDRTTELVSYQNKQCAESSWLYMGGTYWTLTSMSDSNLHACYLRSEVVCDAGVHYSYGIRPVLYLDESVYVIDGDGSITKPYIIGM